MGARNERTFIHSFSRPRVLHMQVHGPQGNILTVSQAYAEYHTHWRTYLYNYPGPHGISV